MVTITKALIAGLAIGAANAYPSPAESASSAKASASATATSTGAPAATPDPEAQAQLFQDLFTAPTAVKRFQRLLSNDKNGDTLLTGESLKAMTVFNFNGAKPNANATGGATKSANIETFPILTNLGISTTLGFLNACGINTPHVHPRATEFLTVVEGTVDFGYVLENGLVKAGTPEIAGKLEKFEGTVFPMGSIHYQFNPTCDNAVFVAALNSEDPGTNQVAQGFFNLNAGVVNATLGFPKTIDGKNIEQFRRTIPANIAQDIDNCLVKCKKGNGY
ncbi:RmlC-like cupin [Byssothecium circinans]|uniref:RmlC-like cupin n=1 Tax=Byssothecium circinans TaxID=147558 RepID=A0A6A5UF53_9PLEO|nr:RmlC-like cupin [Byssothecium circinans]